MDLAELQAKRAALVAALGTAQLRVVFHSGGTRREVEYKSTSELQAALAAIDVEIAKASGRWRSTVKLALSKGY